MNQNFNDKNITYGHFVLAKNYRKKNKNGNKRII